MSRQHLAADRRRGEVALTCRIGHSYSPESFYEIQASNIENALWAGVRALEEQSSLATSMAERAAKFGDNSASEQFHRRHEIALANAEVLRNVILGRADDAA